MNSADFGPAIQGSSSRKTTLRLDRLRLSNCLSNENASSQSEKISPHDDAHTLPRTRTCRFSSDTPVPVSLFASYNITPHIFSNFALNTDAKVITNIKSSQNLRQSSDFSFVLAKILPSPESPMPKNNTFTSKIYPVSVSVHFSNPLIFNGYLCNSSSNGPSRNLTYLLTSRGRGPSARHKRIRSMGVRIPPLSSGRVRSRWAWPTGLRRR